MPTAKTNGIEICYETFGSPDDPAMLMIMGLGMQLIAWPDELCGMLADRGYHVIRFDNRDVGLSTWLDDAGVPAMGGDAPPPYTLSDMADDAAGLLDAVRIGAAHVVGVSMGGMIAQLLAIRHPRRVLSLTSIMSTVGGPDTVQPTEEAMAALMSPRPANREDAMDLAVRVRDVIGSTGFPRDIEREREMAGRAFDRAFHPAGFMRHIAAVMAAPSRAEALGELEIAITVIHGDADTLVPVENGHRTAAAAGVEPVIVPGMGHDLPEGAWPAITDATVSTAGEGAARTR